MSALLKQAQLRLCSSGRVQSGFCTSPLPHFNIHLQLSLHENVVFFCLCAHVQCRVCYIYHVEFHFRFRHLLSFPVKHQLWSGCHGGRSSKKTSGKFLRNEFPV